MALVKCQWKHRGQSHSLVCCCWGVPHTHPLPWGHVPDSSLGDGAVEQRAEPPVQPPDAMVTDSLLHTVPCGRAQRGQCHPPRPGPPSTALPAPARLPRSPKPREGLLTNALVAGRVCLLIQLQLCLHILGRECDADLDPSSQATCMGEAGTLRQEQHCACSVPHGCSQLHDG